MKRHAPLLVLAGALALLVAGLVILFQRRVAQGDLFPAYSSLRADPLGIRALHDSLARVPGMRVERQFKPLMEIDALPPRTIVLAGIGSKRWEQTHREDFDALDAAVRGGSRLVLALRASAARTEQEVEEEKKTAREREQRRKELEGEEPRGAKPVYMDLRRRWGAAVKERMLVERSAGAVRTDDERARGLPAAIAWQSDGYFELEADAEWHVLYRRGGRPVLVERTLGRGSLVLVADSYILSNEALQKDRAATLLAWLVGPHARVTFDEAHLGVVAQHGVAALARRYGLSGAFFTLVVLAGLFIWRRMALFVPPAETIHDIALTYHPAAGLEALLRRSVAPPELATTCVTEWKPVARESDRARVEAALAATPGNASPVALYNTAVRALQRRRAPRP